MAEATDPALARTFFERAWAARTSDYEAAIAAHYLARQQPSPGETLRWNLLALQHAEAVGDSRAEAFLPSLLLCAGKAHEDLGHVVEARELYRRARARLDVMPGGSPYLDMIARGVAAGLARVG